MEDFVGVIKLFAGTFAPTGWKFCDGSLLPVGDYQMLYSILGTQFGGDGRTTFKLPDLRGRVPIGVGQGPGLMHYTQGFMGGQETIVLDKSQMPSHSHFVQCDVKTGGRTLKNSPEGRVPANITQGEGYGEDLSGNTLMNTEMITPEGGSAQVENRQPFQAINYIICFNGIYPPRP